METLLEIVKALGVFLAGVAAVLTAIWNRPKGK